MSKLTVKSTKKMGRGVFAAKNICKGEIVEVSPVVVVLDSDSGHSVLGHYVYAWGKKRCALALGLGSLFNHAEDCNVDYSTAIANKTIVYKANRTIKKGQELFISYGYDPKDCV